MATMTSAACRWSGFVRERVNEKRKWRIKGDAAKEGERNEREGGRKRRERALFCAERILLVPWIPSLHCCMLPGQLQHVGLPVCLRSIACVSLIDEVRALGQPAISAPLQAMPHPNSLFTSFPLRRHLRNSSSLHRDLRSCNEANVGEIKNEKISLCLIHSHTSIMF